MLFEGQLFKGQLFKGDELAKAFLLDLNVKECELDPINLKMLFQSLPEVLKTPIFYC